MDLHCYIALPLSQSQKYMKERMFCKILTASFICLFFTHTIQAQSGVVTVNEDAKIPEVLGLKKSMERNNELSDGYTIQLYYGDLDGANKTMKLYKQKYTSWPASIEYETPNYKVWVGNYNTRIDADRAQIEIQKNFPAAFILRPKKGKKAIEKDEEEKPKKKA